MPSPYPPWPRDNALLTTLGHVIRWDVPVALFGGGRMRQASKVRHSPLHTAIAHTPTEPGPAFAPPPSPPCVYLTCGLVHTWHLNVRLECCVVRSVRLWWCGIQAQVHRQPSLAGEMCGCHGDSVASTMLGWVLHDLEPSKRGTAFAHDAWAINPDTPPCGSRTPTEYIRTQGSIQTVPASSPGSSLLHSHMHSSHLAVWRVHPVNGTTGTPKRAWPIMLTDG